jgi:rare lipoprotein A
MRSVSAAHPTMPIPSYARVTNTANGRSIIVRVNDRGPYHGGRILDVSQRVAEALDFRRAGTARIRLEYVGKAGLGGSDDNRLMATLRTDGAPAQLDGAPASAPVMVARDEPRDPAPPAPQRIALTPQPRVLESRAVVAPVAATTIAAEPPREAAPALQATAFAAPAGRAPMPPNRPFDLGTIPGAAVPIAASRPAAALNEAPVAAVSQIQRGEPIAR